MALFYRLLYAALTAAWTVFAFVRGAHNCTGKEWVLNHSPTAIGLLLAAGLLAPPLLRLRQRTLPAGELALYAVTLALGALALIFFGLLWMHQDCC